MLLRMKEVNRLKIIEGCMDGRIGIEEAGRILGRTPRSVYRMIAKVREKGPGGILHGNRNRVSPRRIPDDVRKKLVQLAMGNIGISTTHIFARS